MRLHTHPTRVLPSAPLRALLAAPLLACVLTLLSTVPAGATPESAAGGHDIGELMAAAGEHYDLARLDAVLLLEDLTVTVSAGGRRTTVHRIAWLGTEIGLNAYGDLRIPNNTGTSTLEVVALRTWMDGRWWPDESEISPTAVVETTPGAIQSADDYTTMRETMLLHDGIELPCIVETIYTITERRPPEYGFDGLWIFPKADPAVLTRLAVEVPKGMTLHHAEKNGAPEPALDDSGPDVDTYVWRAEFVDRLARPLVGVPAAYAPHVAWSTWESWAALGETVAASVGRSASLDEALADSVANLIDGRPVPIARAEAVADFINETTRAVRSGGRPDMEHGLRAQTGQSRACRRTVRGGRVCGHAGLSKRGAPLDGRRGTCPRALRWTPAPSGRHRGALRPPERDTAARTGRTHGPGALAGRTR